MTTADRSPSFTDTPDGVIAAQAVVLPDILTRPVPSFTGVDGLRCRAPLAAGGLDEESKNDEGVEPKPHPFSGIVYRPMRDVR